MTATEQLRTARTRRDELEGKRRALVTELNALARNDPHDPQLSAVRSAIGALDEDAGAIRAEIIQLEALAEREAAYAAERLEKLRDEVKRLEDMAARWDIGQLDAIIRTAQAARQAIYAARVPREATHWLEAANVILAGATETRAQLNDLPRLRGVLEGLENEPAIA